MKAIDQLINTLNEFSIKQQIEALEDGNFLSSYDITDTEAEDLYEMLKATLNKE